MVILKDIACAAVGLDCVILTDISDISSTSFISMKVCYK